MNLLMKVEITLLYVRGLVRQFLTSLKLSWLKLPCHYLQRRVSSLAVALQVEKRTLHFEAQFSLIDLGHRRIIT